MLNFNLTRIKPLLALIPSGIKAKVMYELLYEIIYKNDQSIKEDEIAIAEYIFDISIKRKIKIGNILTILVSLAIIENDLLKKIFKNNKITDKKILKDVEKIIIVTKSTFKNNINLFEKNIDTIVEKTNKTDTLDEMFELMAINIPVSGTNYDTFSDEIIEINLFESDNNIIFEKDLYPDNEPNNIVIEELDNNIDILDEESNNKIKYEIKNNTMLIEFDIQYIHVYRVVNDNVCDEIYNNIISITEEPTNHVDTNGVFYRVLQKNDINTNETRIYINNAEKLVKFLPFIINEINPTDINTIFVKKSDDVNISSMADMVIDNIDISFVENNIYNLSTYNRLYRDTDFIAVEIYFKTILLNISKDNAILIENNRDFGLYNSYKKSDIFEYNDFFKWYKKSQEFITLKNEIKNYCFETYKIDNIFFINDINIRD